VHPGLILWQDSGVLAVSWDTVRLFLHILAATVWVGGHAIFGALTAISALAALFLGVLLAG
jgi:hypothetical protein